jgi:hypothetical protein
LGQDITIPGARISHLLPIYVSLATIINNVKVVWKMLQVMSEHLTLVAISIKTLLNFNNISIDHRLRIVEQGASQCPSSTTMDGFST